MRVYKRSDVRRIARDWSCWVLDQLALFDQLLIKIDRLLAYSLFSWRYLSRLSIVGQPSRHTTTTSQS